MIELTAAALPLTADWGWLSSRILGEATLISIAAFVLGYVVSLLWPKQHMPQVFGCLAALALVGGLAYAGFAGASMALVVLLVLAFSLVIAGVAG